MLSIKHALIAATLLKQLVQCSSFILANMESMFDLQLSMSGSLESGIPQDVGVEDGSHEELMYTLGVNLARYGYCIFGSGAVTEIQYQY